MSCIVFLIDESTALAARVAEGTKSKADCFATALNALLGQLATGPPVDVALVGYRRADDGTQEVGCRWGGPLEGRQMICTSQLAASPQTVEDRVRKIPGPGGYGVAREEIVCFPIWYIPLLKAPGSRKVALEFCRDLLLRRGQTDEGEPFSTDGATVPPLVVHLVAELSGEDGFPAAEELSGSANWGTPAPLVFHAHLASSSRVPSTLYPSTDAHLSPELLRRAFQGSNVLPEPLAAGLRAAGAAFRRDARGLIYNARMVDLIRFLSVAKAYAGWAHAEAKRRMDLRAVPRIETHEPQDGSESHPTTLVVFVLDRASATPEASSVDATSAWRRLKDRANDLVGQVARQADGPLEIAVVAYGADPGSGVAITEGIPAAAEGRIWYDAAAIFSGAIRMEEFSEQVSNGIGGLLTITRKRPALFDVRPTAPASPVPAFARVAELLDRWSEAHPGAGARPVVVHCTRGQYSPEEIRDAAAKFEDVKEPLAPVTLYHVVVTESSHRAMAYPAAPECMEDEALRTLWELTSPLLRSSTLAGRRPGVSAQSRGMVVNAAFDALADSLCGER